MGTAFSNDVNVKVELYKWSSAEFPEEYALLYTSLDDEFRTCTFRLSANRDKVLYALRDCLCEDEPVQVDLELNTERENNGDLKFGEMKVNWAGSFSERDLSPSCKSFKYQCQKRKGDFSVVTYIDVGHANQKKQVWNVSHTHYCFLKPSLRHGMIIVCDKGEGLCVVFRGPFKYKGGLDVGGVHIDRKVLGEPPNSSDAIVKSEFKDVDGICKGGEGNSLPANVLSAGLINNLGRQTQGKYNGSIFSHCHFNETHDEKMAQRRKNEEKMKMKFIE